MDFSLFEFITWLGFWVDGSTRGGEYCRVAGLMGERFDGLMGERFDELMGKRFTFSKFYFQSG